VRESASLVHLRSGSTPVFWNGDVRLEDPGAFAVLSDDILRRLVCVPLDDEQLATYRQRNFVSVGLRIKDLGAFQLEAYVQEGRPEIVVENTERADPWSLFREHRDLLAEARAAPQDADVYWNLGVAFSDEREYQLAWHAFEKALSLVPDDVAIQLEIGRLLGHNLGRVDDAIAALERAAAMPNPAPDVHVELAIMLRSSDRLPEAQAAVRRGLEAHPDHRLLLEALGVILIELERADEAIPVLERSLEVHGSDPEIEELLGQARSTAWRR
jgi:tetratricopeptide (TPR) repeat protein